MLTAIMLAAALRLPAHTPGKADPKATAETVCATKWGTDRRHVTEGMKREAARRYGLRREDVVARGKGPCCEFDHLLPRELGGADDADNIWPQPWAEAAAKDRVENLLHRRVCAGGLSLEEAQRQVREWWKVR